MTTNKKWKNELIKLNKDLQSSKPDLISLKARKMRAKTHQNDYNNYVLKII